MNWRQRVLSAVAHPNVAYILLSLGTLGLTIELWSPGAVLPGVAGGLCLLLAFFAFQILPVNYAGPAADPLRPVCCSCSKSRLPATGCSRPAGSQASLFGSMILMDSSEPELQLSLTARAPDRAWAWRHRASF